MTPFLFLPNSMPWVLKWNFAIKATFNSKIGTTKLISYFSEEYGFIRFEYELINDIKVNIWLNKRKEYFVIKDVDEKSELY